MCTSVHAFLYACACLYVVGRRRGGGGCSYSEVKIPPVTAHPTVIGVTCTTWATSGLPGGKCSRKYSEQFSTCSAQFLMYSTDSNVLLARRMMARARGANSGRA